MKPVINGNSLEFGDFVVPMNEVAKFTDSVVITRRFDLYFVWRYSTKYHLEPRWHCEEISSHWLTVIYSPLV